jgi:hypothetical protein
LVFSPRASARPARPSIYILLLLGLVSGISSFTVTPVHRPSQAATAVTPTLTWYRGNTHAHTTNSDGDSTPFAVASRYKDLGYNFLVITDHNTLTDVADLNAQLSVPGQYLVIKGEEVTDNCNGKPVHLNALNNQSAVLPQNGADVLSTIENNAAAIRQAGGLPLV